MLRGPDLTGTPVVPVTPTPTKSVPVTPATERASATDGFRATPEVVVVRSGDTLGHLAARYHVSLAELKELNPELFQAGADERGRKRAANGHWIYPGDKVRLRPSGGTDTSTEALAAQVRAARLTPGPSTDQAALPPEKPEVAEPDVPQPETAAVEGAPPAAEPAQEAIATSPPADPAPPSREAAPQAEQASIPAAPVAEPLNPEPPAPPTAKPEAAVIAEPPVAKASEPTVIPDPPVTKAPEPTAKPKPPAAPAKSANVYAIERYAPRPIPTSPPPMPTTMAEGQRLGKKEQLIIGGLLAGLSLVKLPESIERSIGNSAVDGVLAKSPLYTRNPEIVRYVASVGAKVVNQSDRTNIDWRFYVVDSPQINAFALPGGHVFITSAALRNLKSEAELAGVLAHEIAHVEKRHGTKQLQKTLLAQGVAIAALGDQSAGVQVAGQLAIGVAMNGYSRSQEDEADQRGTDLAAKAGYDPKGLLGFFETLKQAHPDSPEWMAWASDHPRTGDRIQRVSAHIAKEGLTGPPASQPDPYRQVMSRL